MVGSNQQQIADAKRSGDQLYATGLHAAAVDAYTSAVALCEQRQDPSLLHLLYANRCLGRARFV